MWYHVYSAAAAALIFAASGVLKATVGDTSSVAQFAPAAVLLLSAFVLIHWLERDAQRFEVSGAGWWVVGLFTPVSLLVLMAYFFRSRGPARGLLACGVAFVVLCSCIALFAGGMRVGELVR